MKGNLSAGPEMCTLQVFFCLGEKGKRIDITFVSSVYALPQGCFRLPPEQTGLDGRQRISFVFLSGGSDFRDSGVRWQVTQQSRGSLEVFQPKEELSREVRAVAREGLCFLSSFRLH
uniref:Uncharacterized protein n=1 Tax=Sphaerodactylus townsendi TaxID=933632 RepID=A0ACB8EH88_9SAUR